MGIAERFSKLGLFWPSITLVAAGVALLIGAQTYFALETDTAAMRRESALVQNGISSRIRDVAAAAVSECVWDEAVANLDNSFSLDWAEENIGTFFSETNHFEVALVLNRDDRAIYAMRDAQTVDARSVDDLRAGADGVVAAVRQAEIARGPLSDAIASGRTMSAPIAHTAVAPVGGELFIFTATLVQPDFGRAMPRTSRSAIVVTGEAVDADFVGLITDRFLLRDAHLRSGAGPYHADRATAAIADAQGRTLAVLDWAPRTPGTALLRQSLPLALLVLSALGALAWGLYRHGRRTTQSLIASEARASHLAYHDALTGLANRTLLGEKLARALESHRRTGQAFAVHCIDLDRFKEVNDTFGHHAGDELITAAARLLGAACRQSDTLARLGGDEFAIVQIAATPDSAAAMADRIVKLMAEPIDLPVGRVFIGCSVGVTIVRDDAMDGHECLRQADLALYRAKDAGRGRYAFFEPEMDAAIRMRRSLQADLRMALANNELTLAYQPQVKGNGKIVGLEALVRWNHPTRGEVAPSLFVPLAEESGLIDALGIFTLRRAFEDGARWKQLKVAVNISAAQLRMKDFVPQLADLVMETGISPSRYELEITEGLLLGDDALTHSSLQRIRAMGFTIALDDFGTGYSSLSYLKRYPIDKIKIDRSFITNLGVDKEAGSVVSAIVKLARALGLTVIAEGVETESQRMHLAAAGCDDVQGFLYGKPSTAAAIERLLSMTVDQRLEGVG